MIISRKRDRNDSLSERSIKGSRCLRRVVVLVSNGKVYFFSHNRLFPTIFWPSFFPDGPSTYLMLNVNGVRFRNAHFATICTGEKQFRLINLRVLFKRGCNLFGAMWECTLFCIRFWVQVLDGFYEWFVDRVHYFVMVLLCGKMPLRVNTTNWFLWNGGILIEILLTFGIGNKCRFGICILFWFIDIQYTWINNAKLLRIYIDNVCIMYFNYNIW